MSGCDGYSVGGSLIPGTVILIKNLLFVEVISSRVQGTFANLLNVHPVKFSSKYFFDTHKPRLLSTIVKGVSFQNKSWEFSKTRNKHPYGRAIPLLGIYPKVFVSLPQR